LDAIFYLKKKHKNEAGEICIYLRITVDSACVEVSTKRKCFTKCWSQKAERAEGKSEYARNINMYLDAIKQKVFEAKRKLIELDIEVTPHAIKDLMLGKNIKKQNTCSLNYLSAIMSR
jgi:hypothetical protein